MGTGGKGGHAPEVLSHLVAQIAAKARDKKYFAHTDTVLEFEAVKTCLQRLLWASCEKGWVEAAATCVELSKDPRELVLPLVVLNPSELHPPFFN